MSSTGKKSQTQIQSAEKQETLLTLSILTLAAILCKLYLNIILS